MKKSLLVLMITMLGVFTASAQRKVYLNATYDSNFGKMSMTFNLESGHVTGYYAQNGRLLGTIDQNKRVKGFWVQEQRSGMMEFDMSEDFKQFAGKFGVDDNLTGGVWEGTSVILEWVTGEQNFKPLEPNAVYEAEYNSTYGTIKLTIDMKKKRVRGTYGIGGKIEGRIGKDNRVSGTWGRKDDGRFEFDFTPDYQKFTGKWGEKSNTLTDGVWVGECFSITKIN